MVLGNCGYFGTPYVIQPPDLAADLFGYPRRVLVLFMVKLHLYVNVSSHSRSKLKAMVQVKQVVDRELYSAKPTETVAEVTRRMAELAIGAIVVIAEGRLQGVFSERDVMIRVVIESLDPETTQVAQVMTTDVVSIAEDVSLEFAMETMRLNQCRHLPVMRGDEVVGFLSMRDLMNFELARKTEELNRMRAYIHGAA